MFIKKVYYCPHLPNAKVKRYNRICNCRKPQPGMIFKAVKDFNILVKDSVLIGDKYTDIEAGIKAGIKRNYLIKSKSNDDKHFSSLLEAVETIF